MTIGYKKAEEGIRDNIHTDRGRINFFLFSTTEHGLQY